MVVYYETCTAGGVDSQNSVSAQVYASPVSMETEDIPLPKWPAAADAGQMEFFCVPPNINENRWCDIQLAKRTLYAACFKQKGLTGDI